MTEAEWLTWIECDGMLSFLLFGRLRSGSAFGPPGADWLDARKTPPTGVSDRKLRLFACACCRRIWHHLGHPTTRDAVEVAERFADGRATREELDAHHSAAAGDPADFIAGGVTRPDARTTTHVCWLAAQYAKAAVINATCANPADPAAGIHPADVASCDLLRDIFGNPFRPVSLDPAWRTPTAVALASQMYESRDFGAMPILADALQDAGCDSDDVLDHCRGPGPHVRGCWVVDLVLGRSDGLRPNGAVESSPDREVWVPDPTMP
jgi:hypothetical protein